MDIGAHTDIQHGEAPPASGMSPENYTESKSIGDRSGMGTKPDIPRIERKMRQVGLVKVLVEVLALSQQYRARCGSENQSESEVDESDQAQEENNQADGWDATNRGDANNSGSSYINREYTNRNGGTKKRAGEDGEDDRDDNKRTCRRPPESQGNASLRRLACPYQAYDRYQVCLRPGRSNTEGGCNGIGRLKSVSFVIRIEALGTYNELTLSRQHLRRRHVLSFRCQRCWKSFDTRNSVSEHQTHQPLCDPRQKPWDEQFMTPEQEVEFEQTSRHKTEEEAWWSLFRLLIPGMQSRDTMSLATNYSPCE